MTGGYDSQNEVELYIPSSGFQCSLPALPDPARMRHSQNGLLICGGDAGKQVENHNTCISFTNGSWITTHTLKEPRTHHASWEVEKDIFLIGGFCSDLEFCNNTEVVQKENTTIQPPFSLKHMTG